MVPLRTNSDAVAAYLRRDGKRAILVVVNLGASPLTGVRLSSTGAVLPAGRYLAKTLLGGKAAAQLRVATDGSIQTYIPLPMIRPMASHLFELELISRPTEHEVR